MVNNKKHSEDTKRKISDTLKRKKIKPPVKSGKESHLYGKKFSESHRKNMGLARKGKKLSEEHKKKISKSHTGKKVPSMTGENHPFYGKKGKDAPNWKNGSTSINMLIRSCFKNKAWSIEILKRDDYTCQVCNIRGGKLHVHHIKLFSLILKENNIKNLTEAIHCDELWNKNNGITLCKKCHKEEHNMRKNEKVKGKVQ